jgi:hypothetical protein
MKSDQSTPPPSSEPGPSLPPFLKASDPMELEDVPLQVALLTMEAARSRLMLAELGAILETAGRLMIEAAESGLTLDDG